METTNLKYRNVNGWKIPYNQSIGIFPILTFGINKRINEKKAVNLAITGEAGIGKSYSAIQLAMMLDSKFNIDEQVVFNLKEFMEAVIYLKTGKPIVFDEPSYAIGKHDWYKQINNALRKTIESFRYKLHPLIIPIISLSLLDKTVRSFLLQYLIVLTDRGEGRVYSLSPAQFGEDKTYYNRICDWNFKLYSENCIKDSCLSCIEIKECTEWRAIYERKKASIQEERYTDVLREAIAMEDKVKKANVTTEDVLEKMEENFSELVLTQKKRIDQTSIKILLEKHLHIHVTDRKAEEYSKRFMQKFPDFIQRFNTEKS